MATDNRESELVQVLRSETLLGEIPLQLICEDLNVIAAFPPPRPYFVIASRYSYLHIIAAEYIQDLRSHYIVDTETAKNDVWFECQGYPLRSHWPIGVLFDVSQPQATALTLPWKISVKFQQHPNDVMVKCQNINDTERLYFQALKQALYLLHGSTAIFNNLSGDSQKLLWESLLSRDRGLPGFESVAKQLRPKYTVGACLDGAVKPSGWNIPIRILKQLGVSSYQRPVAVFPKDQSAQYVTIKDAVVSVLGEEGNQMASSGWWIMAQGAEIPWDAPAAGIWEIFCSCDLFLYLILHEP